VTLRTLTPAARLASNIRQFVLAVTLSSIAGVTLAATDPKASRLYEDALRRFENKDHAGAILQLKNALQVDPSMLPVQVLLGRALLANGDVVAAEVAFSEALRLGVDRSEVVVPLARAVIAQGKQKELLADSRLSPNGLRPASRQQMLLILAGAAADLGDRAAALRSIDEARTVDNSNIEVYLAEASARIRFRQVPEAMAAVDKALAIDRGSAEALYLKGSIFQGASNIQAALPFYDKALVKNPRHLEALISRAGAALDLNRIPDLERDVAAIEAVSPKDPRGLYLKAMAAGRRGQQAAASDAFRSVAALLDAAPYGFLQHRPQLLMIAGLSHHALGEYQKAKSFLEALQAQQPANPASKLLGQLYLRDKNFARAAESLEGYLRGSPNDTQAIVLYASVNMALGRHARAAQLTQDALRRQDNPDLRAVLGASLVGTGRLSEGAAELEAAVRKDPGNFSAAATLVMLNLGAGRTSVAVQRAASLQNRHPQNISAWNLLGTAKAAAGDVAGARKAFESALALSPKFAPAEMGLARLEISTGLLDSAARRLAGILAVDSGNVEANVEVGLVLERQGHLADAQRYIEKADELSGPNSYDAALTLLEFHLRHGKVDAARKALDRAQTRSSDALPVLLAQARVYQSLGDLPASRSALTRASSAATRDPATQVRIALLQLQVDTPAAAAYSVGKALEVSPRWLPAVALMADIELRQDQLDMAEQRAKAILTTNPNAAVGHAILGDVAVRRGKPELAIAHYRRAHDLDRSPASALRLYGTAKRLNEVSADRFAQDWLKSQPDDVAFRRVLASDLSRTGKFAAARLQYEAILQKTPNDAAVLNDLANVLIELGLPSALPTAERALALKPSVPYIIGTAGWAAYKQGQLDRALQLLRDARLRDPDNLDTRFFLASTLAKSGRMEEARAELDFALGSGRPFQYATAASELAKALK
jgi:cellulose synthase operon protein C